MYSTREQGPTLSLNEILILAFKRVFKWIPILKSYFHKHRYQLIPIEKFISKKFEMVVVRSFCFGLNIFSAFGINRQKQRTLEPFYLFFPIEKRNISERLYQLERWRNTGKG
jgi:hypothetical protein